MESGELPARLASLIADKYFGGVYHVDYAQRIVRFGPVKGHETHGSEASPDAGD